MKNSIGNRRLISSILIFFYIVIGYMVIVYFLDPTTFVKDLVNQWWIIPFALMVSAIRYSFSKKEATNSKNLQKG